MIAALDRAWRLFGTGFSFAAHRWTDVEHILSDTTDSHPETTTINELGTRCEIANPARNTVFGVIWYRVLARDEPPSPQLTEELVTALS